MTVPTGQGQKCDLNSAGEPGSPLASRPERAKAHDAMYSKWDYDAKPKDKADDAVVDMTANPVHS